MPLGPAGLEPVEPGHRGLHLDRRDVHPQVRLQHLALLVLLEAGQGLLREQVAEQPKGLLLGREYGVSTEGSYLLLKGIMAVHPMPGRQIF